MIPNPILKVLSSMRAHRVRALLMGGQACVFYGAAEFSRDTDFAILAEAAISRGCGRRWPNLQAEAIAVPPFEIKFLRKGHAMHFRCQHPEALRMRVDVMSKMRGVDSFDKLWQAADNRCKFPAAKNAICFRCPIWCRRRKPSATRTGR